ncbi:MAG: PAS domain S-box protein [Candidatus Heimdallarchaeota archaeon]
MLVNIVENSKEVVISVDESGKIIYANAPTEEVLGYKPEELIGAQISILAHQVVSMFKRICIKVHWQLVKLPLKL